MLTQDSKSSLIRALVVLPLLCATAVAGPLAVDGSALPSWTGTMPFIATGLKVDVDYAVFAPGTYPDDLITGDDPSDGREYLYAYQAFVRSDATVGLADFSVGLYADSNAGNAGTDWLHMQTGGMEPFTSLLTPDDSVWWPYSEVAAGNYTTVMLFTSPYGPDWQPASVRNAGTQEQLTLPSPVPEPGAAWLGLLGVSVLASRRRRGA